MPYTFDLDFQESGRDDLPCPPHAHVMVSAYGRREKEGMPLIGIECVSGKEFDYEIDRLIEELNEVRKKAHQKFAAADKRMKARLNARETP